jgi:hypothetical protein
MGLEGVGQVLAWAVGRGFDLCFSLFCWEKLVVEQIFEYNRSMELGDPTVATRDPRSRLDAPSTPSTPHSPS